MHACLRSDIRKLEAQVLFQQIPLEGRELVLEGKPNSCQRLKKIPDYWDMAMLDFIIFL
jgi:hypothetical protein